MYANNLPHAKSMCLQGNFPEGVNGSRLAGEIYWSVTGSAFFICGLCALGLAKFATTVLEVVFNTFRHDLDGLIIDIIFLLCVHCILQFNGIKRKIWTSLTTSLAQRLALLGAWWSLFPLGWIYFLIRFSQLLLLLCLKRAIGYLEIAK